MEVYVDGMVVKSKRKGDHLDDLTESFNLLRKYQKKLNMEKCIFVVQNRKFLGYVVTQRGTEANSD